MDFIKILSDVISEQPRPKPGAIPVGGVPSSGSAGATAGSNAAQSNNTSSGWSRVPSHNWRSGSKIDSPLKNPDKCKAYGQNRGSGRGYHNACDISAKVGTSLFAPHDGTFTKVDNGICGNGIIIKGKDENGKELHSGFCHLGSREVPSDGKVIKGDYIGVTGGSKGDPGSGRTTGPHLHWTFKVGGQPTNPYTYN